MLKLCLGIDFLIDTWKIMEKIKPKQKEKNNSLVKSSCIY